MQVIPLDNKWVIFTFIKKIIFGFEHKIEKTIICR